MDLDISKGSRFFSVKNLTYSLIKNQKIISLYLPYHSGHNKHVISNYMAGELKRYIRANTEEIYFLGMKVKICRRLLE